MTWEEFLVVLNKEAKTPFGKSVVKALSTHNFQITYRDPLYIFHCTKCEHEFLDSCRNNKFNINDKAFGWKYWLKSCDEFIIKDIIE
jgi:hypothetical protein